MESRSENIDNIENIEDIMKPFWFKELSDELTAKCYEFLDDYYYMKLPMNNIVKKFEQFQRKHKFSSQIIKFGYLICFYKLGRQDGRYPNPNKNLEKFLKVKNVRENSGVMVFSIFTSGYPSYTRVNSDGTTEIVKEFGEDHNGNPGKYSCKYDCFYCPDYPDMPRSYLPGEPSADRENQKHYANNSIMFAQDEEEKPQHKGLGKKLMARAEEIAIENGYKKMSVIAGVGVREYYRKLGYTKDSEIGCYQIKDLVSTYDNEIECDDILSSLYDIPIIPALSNFDKAIIGIGLRIFYVFLMVLFAMIVSNFL